MKPTKPESDYDEAPEPEHDENWFEMSWQEKVRLWWHTAEWPMPWQAMLFAVLLCLPLCIAAVLCLVNAHRGLHRARQDAAEAEKQLQQAEADLAKANAEAKKQLAELKNWLAAVDCEVKPKPTETGAATVRQLLEERCLHCHSGTTARPAPRHIYFVPSSRSLRPQRRSIFLRRRGIFRRSHLFRGGL